MSMSKQTKKSDWSSFQLHQISQPTQHQLKGGNDGDIIIEDTVAI